jgi:hypothetical protein
VFAGCGRQGSGEKERGAAEAAPTTAQYCVFLRGREIACYDYESYCQKAAAVGGNECRREESRFCYSFRGDYLSCWSSLDTCRHMEWNAAEAAVDLPGQSENVPTGGCRQEVAGRPHTPVPVDPPAPPVLERFCLTVNGTTTECGALTLDECEQHGQDVLDIARRLPTSAPDTARNPRLTCERHPQVACYDRKRPVLPREHLCAVSMPECEKARLADLLTPNPGACVLQGTPGPVGVAPVPLGGTVPPAHGCGCSTVGATTSCAGGASLLLAALPLLRRRIRRATRRRMT